MVTFVLVHVRARDHVVLTPAIRWPMKFKTHLQDQGLARKQFPVRLSGRCLPLVPIDEPSAEVGVCAGVPFVRFATDGRR